MHLTSLKSIILRGDVARLFPLDKHASENGVFKSPLRHLLALFGTFWRAFYGYFSGCVISEKAVWSPKSKIFVKKR